MGNLWQDLRYGMRMLARRPGLTAIAVVTLALGIGANTSIFSLVNSVLLRPLPFAKPEQLIVVNERNQEGEQGNVSGHEFVAWRDGNHTLETIALYGYSGFNLTGGGDPEAVDAMIVSGDFFAVLGSVPLVGRAIGRADDETGAPRVAVLSAALWQRRFGGDRSIVGRAITLDNLPYTVIGVMPPRVRSIRTCGYRWTRQAKRRRSANTAISSWRDSNPTWTSLPLSKTSLLSQRGSRRKCRFSTPAMALQLDRCTNMWLVQYAVRCSCSWAPLRSFC